MKKKIIGTRLQLKKKTITNLTPDRQSFILGGEFIEDPDLEIGLGSKRNSCVKKTKAGPSSPCDARTCAGATCLYLDGC